MILVFGATGHIGGELISILSSEGVPSVAVTRAPSRERPLPGIRWAKADLAEPASVDGLLRDVKTMFLLTGNGADLATLQVTAIRAAAKAGVEYVVKLSALGASDRSKSPIGRAHYEAEQELIASGMRWVILRPHVFMQNLLDQLPAIVREGRIFAASGDGKVPFIDTRDIAAVAAVTLTHSGHGGKKYVLTGPEALSSSTSPGFLRRSSTDQSRTGLSRSRKLGNGWPAQETLPRQSKDYSPSRRTSAREDRRPSSTTRCRGSLADPRDLLPSSQRITRKCFAAMMRGVRLNRFVNSSSRPA